MQKAIKNSTLKQWQKWLGILLLGNALYFGNKMLQTRFGEQALEQIEFEILDINVALAKASAHDKLVLADMSAIWCPTCRKLDKTIFSDPQVKQLIEENFVFTRVEYESEQGNQFMQRYGVAGFPVLLVLNGEGEKLTRLPLTFDIIEFTRNLNQVLVSHENQTAQVGN
jgi:thiol:disulfide interchange protein